MSVANAKHTVLNPVRGLSSLLFSLLLWLSTPAIWWHLWWLHTPSCSYTAANRRSDTKPRQCMFQLLDVSTQLCPFLDSSLVDVLLLSSPLCFRWSHTLGPYLEACTLGRSSSSRALWPRMLTGKIWLNTSIYDFSHRIWFLLFYLERSSKHCSSTAVAPELKHHTAFQLKRSCSIASFADTSVS